MGKQAVLMAAVHPTYDANTVLPTFHLALCKLSSNIVCMADTLGYWGRQT